MSTVRENLSKHETFSQCWFIERLPNIKPTLAERLVFAGISHIYECYFLHEIVNFECPCMNKCFFKKTL